ncbi:hypothetical protein [Maribacter hydrothermalis]|uniref:Fibronectin type-III domain-containing protein n=1 Tax=Maribacter hydrothermalis TaxID=1836467 RepID=A0A1B7ZF20_9FLAO|nr:hypothetical protein [Maribacter hydrothermalis]APQ17694.1 hypothetical protein BTR34_10295 [Maribacter hydrothermalis]OBR42169.1 hypothetical protein A9200_01920 [Maribacter hydrothermalis]
MKSVFKKVITVIGLVALASCSGGKDDPIDKPNEGGDLGSVNLVFPENNSECTEGESVNDIESTVTFMWEEGTNVDSYEVTIRNLNTNNINTVNASTNEKAISLMKNTPYEWYVVSKAAGSDQSPSSAKWKFYNAGTGVENYAPFPAAAVNPTRGQTISSSSTVMLEWLATDVDNDIATYEVLFGTAAQPTVSLGTTTQSSISVTVSAGQTYYWLVKTIDIGGNSSKSEVFDFKVQ